MERQASELVEEAVRAKRAVAGVGVHLILTSMAGATKTRAKRWDWIGLD